jgi:hypothetical protein
MITTRESINYQFSLIFGYSSPNDIIVGNVIGPGKLTSKKVNELSRDVVKFLRMYNAMLRDYTGSEVFSIEFDLHNIDESAQINIYPQSMIFIPGKHKDCESLLLALKPETGYLNTQKSREDLNNISKLFFEVEEFADRPDLKNEEKKQVFNKFVTRFSQKLYGKLIEDKWNKKLIGLSTSLPTEKEMLNTYATIISKMEILWYKRPYEMKILNPKFERIKTSFKGQTAIEHLKFSISEPSANFVIENTLKLGSNLINLANTGTIDESQEEIMLYLFNNIEEKVGKIKEVKTATWVISEIEKILSELERFINKFLEYSKNFLNTGEMGDLSEILRKYREYIIEKGKLENENFEDICFIAINSIKRTTTQKEKLRVIDLNSVIFYFSEILKNSFIIIKKSLSKYFSRRRLKTLTIEFIKNMKERFELEQKPVKVLGYKIVEKFNTFLINQIEINPIVLSKDLKFKEETLIKEFKYLVKKNVVLFFENIELSISDLVSFAEVLMEKDLNIIKNHLDKFKKFSAELHYLLSYILRYSTINRYLKEESNEEISDPVTFANKFHRFLEKRIGGINLTWKSYILEWIKEYTKKFLNLKEQKEWNLKEIYDDFIRYFEERESNELRTENFLKFLDTYIAHVSNETEKNHLIDFFEQYEFVNKIKTEFPKYIKNLIEKEINTLEIQLEEQIPINFFNINDIDSFYNYLKEMELKYFSKLIPRPLSLILKHNLTNEERKLFKSDLYHVFNFRFWHNKLKMELADNFQEVYREWIKEI